MAWPACGSVCGRWVDWLNQAWLQCYDKSQRQLQMSSQLDQETLFQKAQSLESQVVGLRKQVASKDQQLQVGYRVSWAHGYTAHCVWESTFRGNKESTLARERRPPKRNDDSLMAHPDTLLELLACVHP